jgi:hypothetical protein
VTTGDRITPGPLDAAAGTAIVAAQTRLLDDACRAVNRDPASVQRLVVTGAQLDPGLGSAEEFRDTMAAYEAIGVTDLVVHWPRADGPFAGDEAAFETVVTAR